MSCYKFKKLDPRHYESIIDGKFIKNGGVDVLRDKCRMTCFACHSNLLTKRYKMSKKKVLVYICIRKRILIAMTISVRIAGRVGGWTPIPHLADPPISGQNSTPGGRVSTPPPKFCWSWYAAWFTLPFNAVLKISRPASWWFECYYILIHIED